MQLSMPIYHPLIGKALPQVTDLLARCDATARPVLEAACRLADYRVGFQTGVSEIHKLICASPWGDSAVKDPPEYPSGLFRSDLLRALFALHPDDVRRTVLGDGDSSSAFEEDTARWRDALARLPATYATQKLERGWGREWACALRRRPDLRLGLSSMIAGLGAEGIRGLVGYAADYVNGLATWGETWSQLCDHAIGVLRHVGIRLLPAVLPAYFDRHQGLAAVSEALAKAPGVLIVGGKSTGRKALLDAWLSRILIEQQGEFLGSRWSVQSFGLLSSASILAWDELDQLLECRLFAWTGNVFDGTVWDFGHSDAGRFAVETIRRLLGLHARKPDRVRLVLTLDNEELVKLSSQVETLALPQVSVPPIEDTDLIPIWFCQAPVLGVSFADVLGAFEVMTDGDRRRISEGVLEEALSRAGGPWEWSWLLDMCRRKEVSAVTALLKTSPISPERARLLQRFIGPIERLHALARLEQTFA